MKLLPYDSFTIVISQPLSVVLQRLNAKVEAPKLYRLSREHAPYQGTVSEQGFQITRIIHYRNSFLPVIKGRFEVESSYQTEVHIKMSLHPFVMAFLGFWFLFWYSAAIPVTLLASIPNGMPIIFLGMPILMLIIFWFAFWTEANRSRNELTQIIQGEL